MAQAWENSFLGKPSLRSVRRENAGRPSYVQRTQAYTYSKQHGGAAILKCIYQRKWRLEHQANSENDYPGTGLWQEQEQVPQSLVPAALGHYLIGIAALGGIA